MGRTSDARERLIDAMASLVHRRGYVAVSVEDVCTAAEVKKGSFYHFFPSKRELMLAALERHWQQGREHFFGVALAPDAPPLERIERLLALLAEMEGANQQSGGHVLGCPFGNLAAEVGATEPELTHRADQAFAQLSQTIRGALAEAQQLGQLAPEVDIAEAADAIVAYFEGVSLLAKARNDPALIRRLARRAIGLAVQPDRGPG